MFAIDEALIQRSHRQAKAERWAVTAVDLAGALRTSAEHAFRGGQPGSAEVDRYIGALHLEDLALATACRLGNEAAWEHFVREYRPALYRTADALDPSGGSRDLADALYAELFGLTSDGRPRASLLQYLHGRSSLATWLRAVLAQRHVDRRRVDRRTSEWPDDESPTAIAAPSRDVDPERTRQVVAMRGALQAAIASLPARDRLRLGCYYAQQLTLAETGRILGEHEATASRQLARTRREIRKLIEQHLRERVGFSRAEVERAVASLAEDAGSLDLGQLLATDRKKVPLDRSPGEKTR